MNLHIIYTFKSGPWGGGNQFLKALRDSLRLQGYYAERPDEAEAVLFNSHHNLKEVAFIRRNFPEKVFIHRLDGPVGIVRGEKSRQLDQYIFYINKVLADGTIFQSNWSKERCLELGISDKYPSATIINAPDPEIFIPSKKHSREKKIKIIATSWSPNWKKGFDVYRFLDQHLDHSRYEMVFVGNSPIEFKHIRHLSPLNSFALANELSKNDLYITASVDDPCSNSLLEALHCSIPAIVRNSGGHPEITCDAGVLFNGVEDVLQSIDSAAEKLDILKREIHVPSIDKVAQRYIDFAHFVRTRIVNGLLLRKQFTFYDNLELTIRGVLLQQTKKVYKFATRFFQ